MDGRRTGRREAPGNRIRLTGLLVRLLVSAIEKAFDGCDPSYAVADPRTSPTLRSGPRASRRNDVFAHAGAADLGSDAVGLSGGREVVDQDEVRGIHPEYSGGARARV